MAIQLDLKQSQFGVPFSGAYFRIVTSAISRQRNPEMRNLVAIDVIGYAAKPESEDTKEVDFRRYHAPLPHIEMQDGEGFLSKCYAWVMAQDDMSGAQAV